MRPDHGATLLIEGFERHDVSPATLTSQAEAVAKPAGDVENFNADLKREHNTAKDGVAGVVADAMTGADTATKTKARSLIQGILVAAGAIRHFAEAVETFNQAIDRLNSQIRAEPTKEKQQAKKAELGFQYPYILQALEHAARTAKQQLSDPLDPDHVRALYAAGALPSFAAAIYSNLVDLTRVSLRTMPFDLAAMTAAKRATFLENHPVVAVAVMELTLRNEGLLTGPAPDGYYREWLTNAARRGISVDTIVDIARTHDVRPDDFEVFDGMERVTDPDGKSFFLLPPGIGGDDARHAVLMTYILNAGTDYGAASPDNDFPETPYSAAEIQRIIDRQSANGWSYDQDVGFVHGNGGRMVTTPNGMLMGLGGNWLQGMFSLKGGTAWGDIFMLNIDDVDDPDQVVKDVAQSGRASYVDDDGTVYQGQLDLDRLLHHEERHSQQWAREGYGGFIRSYAREQLTGGNETEQDAGLRDGGYH
ncbi:hypothetical protein KV100_03975 [Mumia sp. zg.B21]|uniref:hypothetical protein n=1 Tax=Mumia sp. zg.B21 TaxID=2855447 RepID=UPI001C6DF61E|nr:hypothetical protein [Mumia sp. zg.B21]MBW9208803.1 hypothetical protein [Mumia sp. zg.B21]